MHGSTVVVLQRARGGGPKRGGAPKSVQEDFDSEESLQWFRSNEWILARGGNDDSACGRMASASDAREVGELIKY